jgi:hypothetical protein
MILGKLIGSSSTTMLCDQPLFCTSYFMRLMTSFVHSSLIPLLLSVLLAWAGMFGFKLLGT